MCKTLAPSKTQAVSSAPFANSTSFPHTLRRTTAFTGRVMRHAEGGFVAFLEEAPKVMAHGTTPDEAEWNLRVPFAEYVAGERSEGKLCGEIQVLWME
jgi:predicted RNase H-like HicB family nuclease